MLGPTASTMCWLSRSCASRLASSRRAAWQLSFELTVSVYDACYVALADLLELPLVTADEKLVRSLEGTRHSAVFLGMFGEA